MSTLQTVRTQINASQCSISSRPTLFLKTKTNPPYGPRRNKTCLWVFWKSEAQTSLLSYTDYLEIWNFACSKPIYDTFQKANNKGADQTARMRKLVCDCVIPKPPKTGFLPSRPIYTMDHPKLSTHEMSIFHLMFVAWQTVLCLSWLGTWKTSFLAYGPVHNHSIICTAIVNW